MAGPKALSFGTAWKPPRPRARPSKVFCWPRPRRSLARTSRGCLVTLSAVNLTGASPSVCEAMRRERGQGQRGLEARLRRAMDEGELPASLDAGAVAAFYLTVQQGMSIQARDGATRDILEKVARGAMAAWEPLTAG